jgi:lipid A 3-O-deacylase PagL
VTTIRTWASILLLAGAVPAVLPALVLADQAARQPEPGGGAQLRKGTVEVGAIMGTTLPITLFRAHKDRHLTTGTVQIGRVMTNQLGSGPLAGSFEFLLEVAPLIVLQQPDRTFGVAASPLHMRWNFLPMGSRPLRLFAEASGGIFLTNKAVPLRSTRFNFIDQAGFGLRIGRHPTRMWLAGYRFQHISNAGRVKPNPGVNLNFVYAGVSFLR